MEEFIESGRGGSLPQLTRARQHLGQVPLRGKTGAKGEWSLQAIHHNLPKPMAAHSALRPATA